MLSLQECLENIKNAVLGRDVRQSIHDGIKGINDESKADMEAKQTAIEKYTKRQDGVISDYTGKMDLLNSKYEEQIKNMTLASPSDAEIVDSRRTKDNTVFPTLKERLDEDKNSIWTQKQLTSVATLSETPDRLGLLKIDAPENCIIDKDAISIIPVYKNGDGDALTGPAFAKIEKGEKLEFVIEKAYYTSLYYDILIDQENIQGGSMGTLDFPVDLNVKVSYLAATETKVNQFVGKPEELTTASKTDLVSSINELRSGLNNVYTKTEINGMFAKIRINASDDDRYEIDYPSGFTINNTVLLNVSFNNSFFCGGLDTDDGLSNGSDFEYRVTLNQNKIGVVLNFPSRDGSRLFTLHLMRMN